MTRRPTMSRWASWAFVLALLVQSATPWLASVAAQTQQKNLAEICTVYGVRTVVLNSARPDPPSAPKHVAAPGDDHCHLGGLATGLAPLPVVSGAAGPPETVPVQAVTRQSAPRDATARWVAGLKHGPPRRVSGAGPLAGIARA